MYELRTESCFDSAHFLLGHEGKCKNIHGHRWKAVAYIAQDQLQTDGTMKDMVVDFEVFKKAFRALTHELDHKFIVEEGSLSPATVKCLEDEGFALFVVTFRPTAEKLAEYFFNCLLEAGMPASQVDVYETPNNCAIYRR